MKWSKLRWVPLHLKVPGDNSADELGNAGQAPASQPVAPVKAPSSVGVGRVRASSYARTRGIGHGLQSRLRRGVRGGAGDLPVMGVRKVWMSVRHGCACTWTLTVRGLVQMSVAFEESGSGSGRGTVPGQGRIIKSNPDVA